MVVPRIKSRVLLSSGSKTSSLRAAGVGAGWGRVALDVRGMGTGWSIELLYQHFQFAYLCLQLRDTLLKGCRKRIARALVAAPGRR